MIARILIFIMTGIRPLLGPAACRYPESCTYFAIRMFEQQPLYSALVTITKRVLSCY